MEKLFFWVEDHKEFVEIYKKKFKKYGWKVFVPNTLDEGKLFLEKKGLEIDLILLDLMLPNDLGCNLLACIKKYIKKEVPTIVFSNVTFCDYQQQAIKNGADYLFLKIRYPPTEFCEEIKKILENHYQFL